MKHKLHLLVGVSSLLALLLAGGCASPGLRGTPFYTAVDEAPTGAPEDRIWAWPLVYYREPALSILWPFFEKNDEFVALRPLFSVHGLGRDKHEYNVLWPIAQWNWETGEHRIFPYFWGPDYRAVFPLYWHFDHPLDGKGTDTLFPLWYYSRDAERYRFWALGPVFHSKNRDGELGWHVWPLTGHYYRTDESYRFFAWPLVHRWRGPGDRGADTLIPLYYREWDPASHTFLSPLWLSKRDENESWKCLLPVFHQRADKERSRFLSIPWSQGSARDGSGWQLAFPFYYGSASSNHSTRLTLLGGKRTTGERSDWGVVPALSWGTATPTNHSTWLAAGLAHHSSDAAGRSHHVLPLYYANTDSAGSTFISIPYSHRETVSGTRWDLAFPLMYRYRSTEQERWITPLAAGGHSTDGDERWHALLPLYYSRYDKEGHTVATLLGGYRREDSGARWTLWPLLSWGSGEGEDSDFWALAPFIHVRKTADYTTHHVLPFYYWNSRNDDFISPVAARWKTTESNAVMLVPPALSWKVTSTDRSDLWLAGGMAHCSWGREPGPHHVIPLYYRNRETDTFISPFLAKWVSDDNANVTVIPPLLGAGSSSPEGRNLWLLAGLAKASWGEKPGSRYVLPLFYSNPQEKRFISPFLIRSVEDSRDSRFYLPLLTLDVIEGTQRDIWGLAGLIHRSRDTATGASSGYALPLYYYDSTNTFLTPVFGRHRGQEGGFFYPLTPLAGIRTGQKAGGWLFPLFSHTRRRDNGNINGMVLWGPYWNDKVRSGAWLFPLFYHQHDLAPWNSRETVQSETYVFPTFWKEASARTEQNPGSEERILSSRSLFIPFWGHTQQGVLGKTPDLSETSLLLGTWRSKREHLAVPGETEAVVQVQKRLLWWLWRYDRHDKDVEIDIFPGISMDRKGNGFKKTAFFYRLYRNEVSADGKRKLDLLFIPILRP